MPLKELKKPKGRPSTRPPEQELSDLYAVHTAREVAEHYQVPLNTVKTWIAYYRRQERKEVAKNGQ